MFAVRAGTGRHAATLLALLSCLSRPPRALVAPLSMMPALEERRATPRTQTCRCEYNMRLDPNVAGRKVDRHHTCKRTLPCVRLTLLAVSAAINRSPYVRVLLLTPKANRITVQPARERVVGVCAMHGFPASLNNRIFRECRVVRSRLNVDQQFVNVFQIPL